MKEEAGGSGEGEQCPRPPSAKEAGDSGEGEQCPHPVFAEAGDSTQVRANSAPTQFFLPKTLEKPKRMESFRGRTVPSEERET